MMATLFWSIPPLPNPQNLRGDLWLGEGGFLEIVNYWHILSVKPAPTKSAKSTWGFMVGRGRVFRDCQLLGHIVGETRPYQIRKIYVWSDRRARAAFQRCPIIDLYCR